MVFNGVYAHVEAVCYARGGKAFRAQAYHFNLTGGKAQFLHAAGAFLREVINVGSYIIGHDAVLLSKEFAAAGTDGLLVRDGPLPGPGTCEVL